MRLILTLVLLFAMVSPAMAQDDRDRSIEDVKAELRGSTGIQTFSNFDYDRDIGNGIY